MVNAQPIRDTTPEVNIIPSQYRLQQVLETENPFQNIPLHVIAEYVARGHIFVGSDARLYLAAPMKKRRSS